MHLELAGIWKQAFSLWFSIEPAALIHLLPSGLKPNCYKSRAFWNVFISRMEYMRPVGLPVWCGIHGWQINYSIYVTSTAEASGEVQGLYVVRSLVDQKHFSSLSSLMPYFHFKPASIEVIESQTGLNFAIRTDDCENLMLDTTPVTESFRSPLLDSFNEAMNFLQYRNTFVLTSGDFLEFGDLHVSFDEKLIAGPARSLNFEPDLNQNDLQLELATSFESADFHLILGRRERPALLHEYAEIEL